MAGDFQTDNASATRARSKPASRGEVADPVAVALGNATVLQKLRNAAYAMLRSPHHNSSARYRAAEAEDVVQEAAQRALARRSVYDGEHSVVSWLVGFVATLCMERLRLRPRVAKVEQAGLSIEEIAMDLARPAEERSAEQLDLKQILERLPSRDRDLLRWRFFEDVGALEIGRRLGISEAAARVRLYRVLTKLREEMSDRAGEQT